MQMKRITRGCRFLGALVLSAFLLPGIAGCEREREPVPPPQEGPAERAGERMDEEARRAREEAERAGERIRERAEDIPREDRPGDR
jgi:hypothetical protein